VTLPLLANFGLEDGLELKITRRGAPPLGGGIVFQKKNVNFILNIFFFRKGLVEFKCPTVKTLNAVMMLEEGEIRRIRGIA